jgi:hypothetical protein
MKILSAPINTVNYDRSLTDFPSVAPISWQKAFGKIQGVVPSKFKKNAQHPISE